MTRQAVILTRWLQTKARMERGEIRATETQLAMVNAAIARLSAPVPPLTPVDVPPELRGWAQPGPLPMPVAIDAAPQPAAVRAVSNIEEDDVPW